MLRPTTPLLSIASAPYVYPSADAVEAWQVRNADKSTILLNVDSTNSRIGIGQAAPVAPLHVGDSTTNNSSDAMILVSRAVNDTVSGNGHCFSDSSNVTRAGGVAYNSFDARFTVTGTENYDHVAAFQSAESYGSAGTCGNIYGHFSSPTVSAGTVTSLKGAQYNATVSGGAVTTRSGAVVNDATGAGTVGTQYGMFVNRLTKGGTANYSYWGDNPMGIGVKFANAWASFGGSAILIPGDASTTQYGTYTRLTAASTCTSVAAGSSIIAQTEAASFTLSTLIGLYVQAAVLGSGSTVTTNDGIYVAAQTVGSTRCAGIRSATAVGSGKWNLYVDGTAANYLNGNLLIGTTTIPTNATYSLVLSGGATSPVAPSVSADRVTVSPIDTSAGHRNLYVQSEAGSSIFVGDDKLSFQGTTGYLAQDNTNVLAVTATAFGYASGQGGVVTQGTSRVTGVTLDKACGAITLVSAAGSASWQTFTVTNSVVVATDVIRVVQKSGTDKNMIHVTAVAAGSFDITFATTGGTTTEQPVFNFAVLKAVAA